MITKLSQALIQSKSRSDHKQILDSTGAIFFFGTPHNGLRTAELEAMVEDLSGGVETARLTLLKQLRENSEFLETQRDALDDIWPGRKIISFYEVEKTPVVQKSTAQTYQRSGELVEMVKKISAQLYMQDEHRIPVERNHTELVKFPTRVDSTYQTVVYYLKECLEEISGDSKPSESQKKLIEALNAPKVDAFLWNIENAAKGTFTWFLEEQTYRSGNTAKEPSSLLIIGAPGQGKTVLSKFLLQHPRREKQHNVMIIYFFCSDRDDSLKTVNSLLRSLVAQLLCGSPQIRKILKPYEQDPAKAAESDYILWEMFQTAVTASSHHAIYCLLDGLDELEKYSNGNEREKLLDRLKDLLVAQTDAVHPRRSILKFLGTSRQIPEIVNKLQGLTRFVLNAHQGDLKIFVNQRILDLPKNFGKDLREHAGRLLLDETKGTFFLWVSIVVKRFEKIDFPTVASLKKTIEESSTDLDILYNDLFRQINQLSEFAQKVVVWVVYSKRPLTLRELEAALATQMDCKNEESTKDHKTELTPESLTSVLGIILETTTEGFVRLIHQSAKDFIMGKNRFVNPSFGTINPNVYIAKVCMTYLNFDDFKLGHKNYKTEIEALKHSHPLLDYAARHWYSHIWEKSEVEHCFDLVLQIITPPSTLRFWSTVASIRPRDANTRDHPLDVATNADIEWLASYLLSTENKHIEIAKNELEYAMIFGSDSITKAVAKSGKLSGGELAQCVVSNRNVGKEFVEEGLLSGITVTESMVTEALTNWMKGSEQLEALAARHDVEFTPEAVTRVAEFARENVMESLLRTHPSVEVTREVIKAASANKRHRGGVMKVLLDGSKTFELDAEIITATSLNSQGRMEIMGVFLDKEEVTMDENAVALTIRNFSSEVVQILLERKHIVTTEKMLAVASENTASDPKRSDRSDSGVDRADLCQGRLFQRSSSPFIN
ncbi:hypothetical protein BDD12DRAFT_928675 [Trichophaea hybrida]|nr:hypothetical protein BDD12DRAFT_928675 [Trichophaea hybrida]